MQGSHHLFIGVSSFFPNYRFFDILSSFFSVLTSLSLNLALSKKVFLKYFSSLFHPKVDLWNKSFYLFGDILSQQAHFKANIGETVLSIFFHLSTTFICYLFHFLLYIFFLLLTTNFYFHLLIHLSIFSLLSTTFICYFVFLEVSFLFCFTFCFKFFPSFY